MNFLVNASNCLPYRLSEEADGTLIKSHHMALGLIQDETRNVRSRWANTHARSSRAGKAAV